MPKGTPKLLTLAQLQQVFVYIKGRTRKEAKDLLDLADRIERLEEDQSEVAAWKELFDRVERLESDFDAKFERVFYRLLSVESHAYRVDDFLNHGIALKGKS